MEDSMDYQDVIALVGVGIILILFVREGSWVVSTRGRYQR